MGGSLSRGCGAVNERGRHGSHVGHPSLYLPAASACRGRLGSQTAVAGCGGGATGARGSWMAACRPCRWASARCPMEDVVAVTRDGAAVELTEDALVAIDRARAVVEELAAAPDTGVRHLDRVRCPGDPSHPGRAARAAPAVAGPVARRGLRPRGRARGGARPDAAAPLDARDRPHRRTTRDSAAARVAAVRGDHAGGPRVRLARLLRRPGPARPLCAGADGGGRRARRVGCPDAGGRCPRGRRADAGAAAGQGGARADQRHRRDARDARAGGHRPADAAADRRHRRGHECRGPDGHRPGLRRRPPGAAATGGPGPVGRQPDAGARRLGRDGRPPRGPVPPGPGRLLAALLASGARCRPRHRGARRDHRGARAGQRRRQPGRAGLGPTGRAGSSRTATSTERRSPTSSTSWPSWPPTSPRSRSGAATASSTARATTTCRRSSPTTRASTAV